jgi:hypothetical protein
MFLPSVPGSTHGGVFIHTGLPKSSVKKVQAGRDEGPGGRDKANQPRKIPLFSPLLKGDERGIFFPEA